ncbi:hypothetical protein CI109_102714 [Kwoniella shandongensis]|uniref:Uncharacterized protein n=1 Tax=Kwoniella shandongensis TaxID=1734106 RepID=A0A5M6BWT7_9TREE|nr:uncharacterized protein CI109_004964 [Kwoniella shandongensis]KAA5526761.1 hypothetical protein CI109_004964 [Kwoniella shandongensis]
MTDASRVGPARRKRGKFFRQYYDCQASSMETKVIDNAKSNDTQVKTHPVWLGGCASMMAVCITHPIDQTKVRSQTQPIRVNMTSTVQQTLRHSGVVGLWTGVSGSLLRQATYGVTRFSVYARLKDSDGKKGKKTSRWGLVKNGAVAGGIAGLVGGPGELVMVRMCADGVKPPEQQLRYPSALHGVFRIINEEGVSRLFRGAGVTCLRSVIMNAAQLSCYDIIKEALLASGHFTDTVPTHLLTSIMGGTIAVTLCAPVDVMKSRIQSSTLQGVSSTEIIKRSLRKDGVSVLFRGWLPAWLRMTPTTALTFMFFEQLKKLF